MKRFAQALCAACLLAGCGGSSNPLGGACSISLSGSVAATITTCTGAATYDPAHLQGNIAIGITSSTLPAPVKTLAMIVTTNSDIAAGTFNYANANVIDVNLAEQNVDDSIYLASKKKSLGSGSLTVSSLAFVGADGSGTKAYLVHGTLDGTLPQSGGAGSITVHATF